MMTEDIYKWPWIFAVLKGVYFEDVVIPGLPNLLKKKKASYAPESSKKSQ